MNSVATATQIQPYVFFGGRCEEALAFYRKAIGAKVEMVMKYSESPEPVPADKIPPGFENKVMHASFRVGESLIMASDGNKEGRGHKFESFALSLSVPSEADADRAFAALSEGGRVTKPLGKVFWSPRFGMLTDPFGMNWMVSVVGH